MKAILFALACTLAASGCSKKNDNKAAGGMPCAAAIDKAIDGMMASRKNAPPEMLARMQQVAENLRGVLTKTCETDKWSDAVITCFANASDQPGIKKCREGLPPEQAQHLQAEIIKVMTGGMGGGHGGMGMPGHPTTLQPSGAPAGSAAGSDATAGSGSAK